MFEELKKYVEEKEQELRESCGLEEGYSNDDWYEMCENAETCGNASDSFSYGENAGELTAYEGILLKISQMENKNG